MPSLKIAFITLLCCSWGLPAQAIRTLKDLDQVAQSFQGARLEVAPVEINISQEEVLSLLQPHAEEILGSDISLTLDTQVRVPEGSEASLDIEAFSLNANASRFTASLVHAGGHVSLKGKVSQLVEVPVLARLVPMGETLLQEDITWKKVPVRQVLRSTLTRTQDIIGCVMRTASTKVGAPLRKSDLERPQLIKRGDTVHVRLRDGMLSLDMQGVSQDNGEKGKRIRILNTTSKKTLYAVVVAPHVAEMENSLRLAEEVRP